MYICIVYDIFTAFVLGDKMFCFVLFCLELSQNSGAGKVSKGQLSGSREVLISFNCVLNVFQFNRTLINFGFHLTQKTYQQAGAELSQKN